MGDVASGTPKRGMEERDTKEPEEMLQCYIGPRAKKDGGWAVAPLMLQRCYNAT